MGLLTSEDPVIQPTQPEPSTVVAPAAPKSLLPFLPDVRCLNCLNTNIEITLLGVQACTACSGARESRTPAAWKLARCVFARIEAKKEVNQMTLCLARVLTHFTTDKPVLRSQLEVHMRLDKRTILSHVEKMRRDWRFPVGSRRYPPAGLWVITNAEDFQQWHSDFRRQALTELGTAYRLARSNFPELAGQTSLDFAEAFKNELAEVLG